MVTISGGNSVGVFSVNTGVTFTVQNLTIANGNSAAPDGGAITNRGTLTVTNGTFSDNRGNFGGGVLNLRGTVTVTNSTFSGNSAYHVGETYGGGGGAGIANVSGTVTVASSAFSGNSAGDGVGGGMLNLYGTATVTNCTFSGNSGEDITNFSNESTLTVIEVAPNSWTGGIVKI